MGKARTTEETDITQNKASDTATGVETQPQSDPNPILRQNSPIHCPYCKSPCEAKSDTFFTRYRCVNKECGGRYTIKVPRPRLKDKIGPLPGGDGDYSAR